MTSRISGLAFVVFSALLSGVAIAATPDDNIRLGAVFSLSSWGAIGGQAELNAVKLAVDDINRAGGVLGKKLELMVEDNRSGLPDTATAFHGLIDVKKVAAIIGPNWAEFSEVGAPIAESSRVAMITPSGYTPTLTRGKRFVFTLVPPFEFHTAALAEVIKTRGHKRVAILYSHSTYFTGIAEALTKQLQGAGIEISNSVGLNPGESDFRTLISRLKAQNVDGVVVFLKEGGDASTFFKQAKDLALPAKLYSYDLTLDESYKDKRSIEGVTFFRYIGKRGSDLLERYRKTYHSEPTFTVPKAYDTVFLIKQAIEGCGAEPQKIRDCLGRVNYEGVSGPIRFSESGDLIGTENLTEAFVVKGDNFVPALK